MRLSSRAENNVYPCPGSLSEEDEHVGQFKNMRVRENPTLLIIFSIAEEVVSQSRWFTKFNKKSGCRMHGFRVRGLVLLINQHSGEGPGNRRSRQ